LGEFSSQRTKRAGSLRGGLDVGDAVKMKAKGAVKITKYITRLERTNERR
jgi:hypothetical protein